MSVVRFPRIGGVTAIARDVLSEARERNVPFMAGSVAYSAFVSLLPLLLLTLLVASAVGGRALADYVIANTGNYLTPAGQRVVSDAILRSGARTEVSILGLFVLGWGVLKVFRSLDTAFSALYGTGESNSLRDGVVVLGAIALAVAAMVVAGLAFAALEDVPYLRYINPLLLVVGLAVALLPIYYVYPDRNLGLWSVLPGTVLAAAGWAALQALFRVYVSFSSATELYGVIGGVLLLVTWLYFAALVLLLGATVNVVLRRRRPDAGVTTG